MPKKTTIRKMRDKIVAKVTYAVSQEEGKDRVTDDNWQLPNGLTELARETCAQGAVLLKNNNVLPFKKDTKVSVFGRVQIDYFAVGYGSGGDVNTPYTVNVLEGLRNNENLIVNEQLASIYENWCKENEPDHGFWGKWPLYHDEMPLSKKIVNDAKNVSDAAVVVIGRAAGEDRENALIEGSYYLTSEEINMLNMVTDAFDKVVVLLDSGNMMDMSWMLPYSDKLGAVLFTWQGGMESGNGIADLLSGKSVPSGKLSDSIALHYRNYPSANNFGNLDFNNYTEDIYVGYRYFETFAPQKVLFPFGFGLSYTTFSVKSSDFKTENDKLSVNVTVTNTGDKFAAHETIQLYYGAPQGKLGKPIKELGAFAKTNLLPPGASQTINLSLPISNMASFDDSGITGNPFAYVLEEGDYTIYIGTDVSSAKSVGTWQQKELKVTKQLSDVMSVEEENAFMRIKPKENADGSFFAEKEPAPIRTVSLKERILNNLPEGTPLTGDKGYKLIDVKNKKVTLDEFVAQLSLDELEAISRGGYTMNFSLGAKGNAGAMGGVLPSLREKGITPIITTDGPSGIRLSAVCSLLPCGTLLACTWNTELIEKLYKKIGQEMANKGSDVLLAPGMNIHRDPLCGRNFEYFSEDPILSGKMASAMVRGIQSEGVSACPKHFACNNQEVNRTKNDSRISQRALREIYLRGFELCVLEAAPHHIMTSYNKINGVWSHYNYELCTTVLRGEWNYGGNIMTDWWMQYAPDPNFSKLQSNAYRVRAQVDVLMPGGKRAGKGRSTPDKTLLQSYGKKDGITLGEMQRSAKNVLRAVMNSYHFCEENNLASSYVLPCDSWFTIENKIE